MMWKKPTRLDIVAIKKCNMIFAKAETNSREELVTAFAKGLSSVSLNTHKRGIEGEEFIKDVLIEALAIRSFYIDQATEKLNNA